MRREEQGHCCTWCSAPYTPTHHRDGCGKPVGYRAFYQQPSRAGVRSGSRTFRLTYQGWAAAGYVLRDGRWQHQEAV